MDCTKAVEHLGHKSTVGLDEGIGKTVQWMREYYRLEEKRWKEDRSDRDRVCWAAGGASVAQAGQAGQTGSVLTSMRILFAPSMMGCCI